MQHTVDREPVIALAVDYSDGPDVLLARAPIADLAGLRGKRVAVEVETVGVYLLARALERVGLRFADIDIVPMPQDAMIAAFARGEIDAVVTYPPFAYGFEKRDDARMLFSSRELPRELLDVLSIERRVYERRKPEIEALQRAWHRTIVYYRAHPEETIAILAAQDNSPPLAVARAMAGIALFDGADQKQMVGDARQAGETAALLQTTEAVLAAAGALSSTGRAGCCLPATLSRASERTVAAASEAP